MTEVAAMGIAATPQQSARKGKAARDVAPLSSHRDFAPEPSRDPVGLLLSQAESRIPELVPVRHGRMLVSPFTYYRGAALPMAADLATTASSGLQVQLCGDAHLSNFGIFGSPERRLVFDLNDFDETLPGPFEWDVKRLIASLVVAGRDTRFSAKQARRVGLAAASSYRTAMRDFAAQPILDVWYARFDVEDALARLKSQGGAINVAAPEATLAKIRTRDNTRAVAKLTTTVDGRRRIVSNPPLIVPIEELAGQLEIDSIYAELNDVLSGYAATLTAERRHLLEHFRLSHVARKVVGVGSVGTQAWVLLLTAADNASLMLQAKQAQPSVLANYAGQSQYDNEGERVVAGQRMMQAASDIFLGWQRVTGWPDIGPGNHVDYYVRQLRDWKYSLPIETMSPASMTTYASSCGWTLARAHARSGDRIAIAAYLGTTDKFDQAVADFAEQYADQTDQDYAALAAAVKSGRAQAVTGI